MIGRMKLTKKDGSGTVFEVKKGQTVVVGRGSKCDVRVLDTMLSRVHCKVSEENGEYILLDEGSTNGTFVDDKKVERLVLKSGSLIELGTTTIEFTIEEAEASGPVDAPVKKARPKLIFCEKCDGSIPGPQLDSGEALELDGKYYCKDCAPAMKDGAVSEDVIEFDEPDDDVATMRVGEEDLPDIPASPQPAPEEAVEPVDISGSSEEAPVDDSGPIDVIDFGGDEPLEAAPVDDSGPIDIIDFADDDSSVEKSDSGPAEVLDIPADPVTASAPEPAPAVEEDEVLEIEEVEAVEEALEEEPDLVDDLGIPADPVAAPKAAPAPEPAPAVEEEEVLEIEEVEAVEEALEEEPDLVDDLGIPADPVAAPKAAPAPEPAPAVEAEEVLEVEDVEAVEEPVEIEADPVDDLDIPADPVAAPKAEPAPEPVKKEVPEISELPTLPVMPKVAPQGAEAETPEKDEVQEETLEIPTEPLKPEKEEPAVPEPVEELPPPPEEKAEELPPAPEAPEEEAPKSDTVKGTPVKIESGPNVKTKAPAPAAQSEPAFGLMADLGEDDEMEAADHLIRPEEVKRAEELKALKEGSLKRPKLDKNKKADDKIIEIQEDDGTQWFLTLLGRRVGPIGRHMMSVLKRKDQLGELTEEDLKGI